MKRKNLKSLKFSAIILIIIWSVKLFEIVFDYNFTEYGVLPRNFNGLIGIFFSPLIHSDVNHLLSNSLPVIILCLLIFNFYSQIAKKIFIYLYFISGLWLWCIGRESFHIGASGLIYAMASFLFFSGILRKNSQLSAVALLVIFIYGGLFWGLFPIDKNVSTSFLYIIYNCIYIQSFILRVEFIPAHLMILIFSMTLFTYTNESLYISLFYHQTYDNLYF